MYREVLKMLKKAGAKARVLRNSKREAKVITAIFHDQVQVNISVSENGILGWDYSDTSSALLSTSHLEKKINEITSGLPHK